MGHVDGDVAVAAEQTTGASDTLRGVIERIRKATEKPHSLDVSNQLTGISGARALAPCLATLSSSLTSIDLSNNNLGTLGVEALAASLATLTKLKSIRLGNNSLGVDGAKALTPALQELRSLQELRLDHNHLGAHGVEVVLQAVSACDSLRVLDFSDNLVEWLSLEVDWPGGVEELVLSGNPLRRLPREVFARLPRLVRLDVCLDNVADPPPEVLRRGVKAVREFFLHSSAARENGLEPDNLLLRRPALGCCPEHDGGLRPSVSSLSLPMLPNVVEKEQQADDTATADTATAGAAAVVSVGNLLRLGNTSELEAHIETVLAGPATALVSMPDQRCRRRLARLHCEAGAAHFYCQRFAEAAKHFELAADLARGMHDQDTALTATAFAGLSHKALGHPKVALTHFLRQRHGAHHCTHPHHQAWARFNMADGLDSVNEFDEGSFNVNRGLTLLRAHQLAPWIDDAHKCIQDALDLFGPEGTCLSFNGGKDSTVLLHLLKEGFPQQFAQIHYVFFKQPNEFPEVEAYVHHLAKKMGFHLTVVEDGFKDGLVGLLEKTPIKAILMGTRLGDPGSADLSYFCHSDPGWPNFMRVHPILDWSYEEVWRYLRGRSYCHLYDEGYTSLGNVRNTTRNERLRVSEDFFRPAFMLPNGLFERHGRTSGSSHHKLRLAILAPQLAHLDGSTSGKHEMLLQQCSKVFEVHSLEWVSMACLSMRSCLQAKLAACDLVLLPAFDGVTMKRLLDAVMKVFRRTLDDQQHYLQLPIQGRLVVPVTPSESDFGAVEPALVVRDRVVLMPWESDGKLSSNIEPLLQAIDTFLKKD